MLALKEFRSKLKGLPDLLNWGFMVENGVILNKDGSFTTGFYYRGKDMASSTDEELAAVSAHANAAFKKLGTGWMVHADSVRVQATTYPAESRNHFPDPVTRLIDAERRALHEQEGAHFDNIYAIAITYLVPPELQTKVSALFVDDDSKSDDEKQGVLQTLFAWFKGFFMGNAQRRLKASDKVNASQLLSRFRSLVGDIVGSFSAGVTIRPMGDDELMTYLHTSLTGLNHPVHTPRLPMYLDALLGNKDFYTGLAPRIGNKHIRVVTISGFPSESAPGMLDAMNRMPFECRWSTRFIALDKNDAEKRLGVYRRNWHQKRHGLMSLAKQAAGGAEQTFQNGDAVRMAGDADDAVNENSEGYVRYGYYTSVLVIMADNPKIADARATEAAKLLGNIGFPSFIEGINAVEAFLGSLPGHGFQNVRRPLLHSLNLSDLMPLTAIWSGPETAPCPFYPPNSPPLLYAATSGNTPFRLSLHVSDLGHFGIFGPPGMGKSTLLDLIMAQFFRYPNAQVFGFDLGYSMATLCEAANGAHYDIGAEGSQIGFCPLAQLETQGDCSWAADYIELLATLRMQTGKSLTTHQKNEITRSVNAMAADTTHSRDRTLTHFLQTVQDKEIQDALVYYTVDPVHGGLGHLLDAEEDSLSTNRFIIFETSHLIAMGEAAAVPVFLYLFRQIEKRVARSIPTLVPIDEGFRTFGHPLALKRLDSWLETMRKENVAVGFATQNLEKVIESPVGSTIIQATATKFMLPNPEALTQNVAPLYRRFGLNDKQIQNISFARPKQDYYVMNSDGRRMFQLGLGQIALSFVGVSGKDQMLIVRQLQSKYGSQWVYHYLQERGISQDWLNHYQHLYGTYNLQPELKYAA